MNNKKLWVHLGFSVLNFILFISCAASKKQGAFYSRSGYGIAKADSLYAGVPAFQDSSINVFAIDLKYPKYPETARRTEASGKLYCQALIDEKGEVEAVYLDQSLHPSLDQAAIMTQISCGTGRNKKSV